MSSDFNPTEAENALTDKIFDKFDHWKSGEITVNDAEQVFKSTKLPSLVLGQVWAIADKNDIGSFTRKKVLVALRLMGHAQRGEQVSETLLSKRE